MGKIIEFGYDVNAAKAMAADPENRKKVDELRRQQNKPVEQKKPNPFAGQMEFQQPVSGVTKKASNKDNKFNVGVNISPKNE